MQIELTFLGTSAMVPTKDRNHSAVFLKYQDEGLLLDCGEGTQRQMRIADIKLTKVTKVLISHWHGDHVLGIPGFLQSLASMGYQQTLEIYGPKGSKEYLGNVLRSFAYDANKLRIRLIEVEEQGVVFDGEEFVIEAYFLNHGVPCVGYVFAEKDRWKINMQKVRKLKLKEGHWLNDIQRGQKVRVGSVPVAPEDVASRVIGRRVGWISDTGLCDTLNHIARDADVLISEATYASGLEEKSEEYGHLTAQQSAQIASRNGTKKLVLTHFSQRYKTTDDILEEAQRSFDNVVCAFDFMKVRL